ncbi:diguanylate cyclase [Clostridium sp. C2-6-12]|uniref:sensor domain-containing diguanylate cyclase n=1 Tax=Clostridium sp. C2-6-12 TaxID=2698832 RepID=UPI0013720BFB|nr:diguanylate cyclase [Clostridium sp. C2-6-12]
MNIRRRFVIFSIILGIVPVIISTSISIAKFNDKYRDLVEKNIIASAHDQAMHLEYFFKQNVEDLKITSNMPVTKDVLNESNNKINNEKNKNNIEILNRTLSDIKIEKFYLDMVALINEDGIVISASDIEKINQKIMISNEELKKLTNSKVVFTNIMWKANETSRNMIIAFPIFMNNKYQGAMINVINMGYFENIVNDVSFYDNGKIVIMDENGVIASSNSDSLKENINKIALPNTLYEQWKRIDFEKNPNGVIEYTIDGVEKIGHYSTIEEAGWIVFSAVDLEKFNKPRDKNIINIVIILVFIFIITIISYMLIINYFSKPIYKLLNVIRKIKQGDYSDRFIYNRNNEFGEIAEVFNDLIDSIEKNKKYIEAKNRDLKSITSNVPGGVHRCKIINGDFYFDFLSGGCLNLLGYEKYEFKDIYRKKIINLVYENDRERLLKEINEQLNKSNKYTVEYRIKRKDGSIVWVLDNGQIVKDREGNTFSYNVAINITESKITQEELKHSEERYRIIMSQTEDIIFEWDVIKDTIYFSENWKYKFNSPKIIENVSKSIFGTDIIYEEDIRKFRKLLNDIVNGNTYEEEEIRLKKNNGEYIWCKIRITAMFDENGYIFKAVGAIINIHKEKIETEELLFKAQRDSLTELFNKGNTQNMIEQYMINNESDAIGALFVIDVDNFKAINDDLGHLAGDKVLKGISSMFLEVFTEDSIIGRIGGDEFIVFLKDINSEEALRKKADELVNGFKREFIEVTKEYKVSGSIGIALYPQHGKSFKELFENADKAVYLAKKKGKDIYCLFGEELTDNNLSGDN